MRWSGDGAAGARGHRSAPGGALAGVGSLRASAAAAPLPLLPVLPISGLLDPFSHPFLSSFLVSSVLSLSLLSFCPAVFPALPSLPGPPAHRPLVSPSSPVLLPPAGSCFSLLFVLAPSCQLSGFPQQEMKGTSWEIGVMGRWDVSVCVCNVLIID